MNGTATLATKLGGGGAVSPRELGEANRDRRGDGPWNCDRRRVARLLSLDGAIAEAQRQARTLARGSRAGRRQLRREQSKRLELVWGRAFSHRQLRKPGRRRRGVTVAERVGAGAEAI